MITALMVSWLAARGGAGVTGGSRRSDVHQCASRDYDRKYDPKVIIQRQLNLELTQP
jgi:hypothetical protein